MKIERLLRCRLGKAIKVYMWSIVLSWVAASLLVTGCCSISTTHTQDICAPRFATSDPAQVEILPSVPARPHIELGQVSMTVGSGTSYPIALEWPGTTTESVVWIPSCHYEGVGPELGGFLAQSLLYFRRIFAGACRVSPDLARRSNTCNPTKNKS